MGAARAEAAGLSQAGFPDTSYLYSVMIHSVLVMAVVLVGIHGRPGPEDVVRIVLDSSGSGIPAGADGEAGSPAPAAKVQTPPAPAKAPAPAPVQPAVREKAVAPETAEAALPAAAEGEEGIVPVDAPVLAAAASASPEGIPGATGTGYGAPGGQGKGDGAGGTGSGGSGSGGCSGGSCEEAKARYVKEHFQYIRDLIVKNLSYPRIAKRMGWKGQVTVRFVIGKEGCVESIRVTEGSGHKVLDENVVSTIRGIQPFPRPPVRAEIVIPIEYRIG